MQGDGAASRHAAPVKDTRSIETASHPLSRHPIASSTDNCASPTSLSRAFHIMRLPLIPTIALNGTNKLLFCRRLGGVGQSHQAFAGTEVVPNGDVETRSVECMLVRICLLGMDLEPGLGDARRPRQCGDIGKGPIRDSLLIAQRPDARRDPGGLGARGWLEPACVSGPRGTLYRRWLRVR